MASDSHAKRPIVVERRKEKGRKKTPRLTKTYDVKIIPATVGVMAETEEPPKKRVAAYCRVSTDQEAQETSLEEQMAHFNTVIAEHPDWELAGIYADEGISGTQVKHRVQFQQMIEDLYCCLRFRMACGHGCSVCTGRYGRHPGACGTCI